MLVANNRILVWGARAKDSAESVRIEEAFPAIVSKTQFRRVNGLMRSRAPRVAHPRRVASSYLLSGLVKCNACNGAGLCRGVTAYVIDPEGEYADMARAAGGRVLSPGVPGQGMNPFVIERGDSEELLQRIGSLRRLIEVMVGERLSAEPPSTTPWRATTTSPTSAPASGTSTPTCKETRREAEIWRGCCAPSPPAACATSSPTRAAACCPTRR